MSRTGKRKVVIAFAMLVVGGGMVASAAAENLARGRALYENHCVVCHTPKIHTRPNRLPLNIEDLQQIVNHWAKQEGLRWSEEDTADVVWFLNQTKYRF